MNITKLIQINIPETIINNITIQFFITIIFNKKSTKKDIKKEKVIN